MKVKFKVQFITLLFIMYFFELCSQKFVSFEINAGYGVTRANSNSYIGDLIGAGLAYNLNKGKFWAEYKFFSASLGSEEYLSKYASDIPVIDIFDKNFPLPQIFLSHDRQTMVSKYNFIPKYSNYQEKSIAFGYGYNFYENKYIYFSALCGIKFSNIIENFVYFQSSNPIKIYSQLDGNEYITKYLVFANLNYFDIGGNVSVNIGTRLFKKLDLGIRNRIGINYGKSTNIDLVLYASL